MVCDRGAGRFEAHIYTGAGVEVGAVRNEGFSARACSATLHWKGQEMLTVPSAAEMDVDVLGADLGLGTPVVTFQTRQSILDWQSQYEIYSFDRKPRLLRTITGSDSYRAVDADLNGRIAIWAHDGAAAVGFDNLNYADFDALPTVVLRFEHRQLADVSAEYAPHYDETIAKLRSELDGPSLNAFRASDGKLLDGSLPAQQLFLLRKPKVKVLEIVWAFLYSGRPQQAWDELRRDWPASDVERAQAGILEARKKGIDAQVAAVVEAGGARHRSEPVVYDTTATVPHAQQQNFNMTLNVSTRISKIPLNTLVDSPPEAILLLRKNLARSTESVQLLIDAAGKVHAAKLIGNAVDPEILNAAMNWKFVPAFRGGRAVPCRDVIEVSPER